jgi:hypothetical protein
MRAIDAWRISSTVTLPPTREPGVPTNRHPRNRALNFLASSSPQLVDVLIAKKLDAPGNRLRMNQ